MNGRQQEFHPHLHNGKETMTFQIHVYTQIVGLLTHSHSSGPAYSINASFVTLALHYSNTNYIVKCTCLFVFFVFLCLLLLVLIPDPKPTPAQITFSNASYWKLYSPDEDWWRDYFVIWISYTKQILRGVDKMVCEHDWKTLNIWHNAATVR